MTVKHLFPHTDCNQLPTRSSWNTKDNPDPSWLSSIMDRSNGANNLAKWWVIQKPFPFGPGRSFHVHSERGCGWSSLPDLGCAVGSGGTYPAIGLHTEEGISKPQGDRLWPPQSSDDGVAPSRRDLCRGSPRAPGPLSMLLRPCQQRPLGSFAVWLPGRFEWQEMRARKRGEVQTSLPASFLL